MIKPTVSVGLSIIFSCLLLPCSALDAGICSSREEVAVQSYPRTLQVRDPVLVFQENERPVLGEIVNLRDDGHYVDVSLRGADEVTRWSSDSVYSVVPSPTTMEGVNFYTIDANATTRSGLALVGKLRRFFSNSTATIAECAIGTHYRNQLFRYYRPQDLYRKVSDFSGLKRGDDGLYFKNDVPYLIKVEFIFLNEIRQKIFAMVTSDVIGRRLLSPSQLMLAHHEQFTSGARAFTWKNGPLTVVGRFSGLGKDIVVLTNSERFFYVDPSEVFLSQPDSLQGKQVMGNTKVYIKRTFTESLIPPKLRQHYLPPYEIETYKISSRDATVTGVVKETFCTGSQCVRFLTDVRMQVRPKKLVHVERIFYFGITLPVPYVRFFESPVAYLLLPRWTDGNRNRLGRRIINTVSNCSQGKRSFIYIDEPSSCVCTDVPSSCYEPRWTDDGSYAFSGALAAVP
jgi:hypothetical protein